MAEAVLAWLGIGFESNSAIRRSPGVVWLFGSGTRRNSPSFPRYDRSSRAESGSSRFASRSLEVVHNSPVSRTCRCRELYHRVLIRRDAQAVAAPGREMRGPSWSIGYLRRHDAEPLLTSMRVRRYLGRMSPDPPVKTMTSRPPSAAASGPLSHGRSDRRKGPPLPGAGSSLPARVRMSLDARYRRANPDCSSIGCSMASIAPASPLQE